MSYKSVSNEAGLSVQIMGWLSPGEKNVFTMIGGNSRNLTWDEYLNQFKEDYQPHVLIIWKSIEENSLIGETGQSFANDHSFQFSDGEIWTFTWRAWGDLMQAIVNKREGYIAYYM
jgi:hypothetical protein